jgi:hypothetical protein
MEKRKILEKFCHDKSRTGLLLMSMPTGFGKTYSVLDFIYKHYQEFVATGRKIFFVTNLKKNLPDKELEKRFIQDGKGDEYAKHVLFIDSNFGTIEEHFLKIDAEIHHEFKTSIYEKTYKNLRNYLKSYKKSKHSATTQRLLKDEIIKKYEPDFRALIRNKLKEEFKLKPKSERRAAMKAAIKNDEKYQWIGKLYPSVFTDDRTIFFLSMNKFFVKNSIIIDKSYYIHEQLIDGSLIFIDEFDSTKETLLNSIIESGLRHQVNLFNLFLQIHNFLMQNEFPEWLLEESAPFVRGPNFKSPEQFINSLKEEAIQIFNKYNFQHTCKSQEDFLNNKRNFLFQDFEFHRVVDGKRNRIEIISDPQSKTNWIRTKKNTPDIQSRGVDIRSVLNDISAFLNFFRWGIVRLAHNYKSLKNSKYFSQETFDFESAVRTVLNHFRLNDEDMAYLATSIMETKKIVPAQKKKNILDKQIFYESGFRFFHIVDNDNHDTFSKIYMSDYNLTPESFMANVCSTAMVVGISATASIPTNIGNYDLEYLNASLGENFVHIEHDSITRLKNDYKHTTQGYDQISINTEFIETGNGIESAIEKLENLLGDRYAAKRLQDQITIASGKNNIDYCYQRYVRLLSVWDYFLKHPDCHAFLCLFNKFPGPDEPEFDLNVVYEYAKLLLKSSDVSMGEDVEDIIVVLRGNQFQENKEQITKDLGNGKRRFIISVYATVGIGQNLQHPIPSTLSPIHINGYPSRDEMDINGIYLDKPTHLLVNINGNDLKKDAIVKYIFQLEFLVESGTISRRDLKNKIEAVVPRYFKQPFYKKTRTGIRLYETDAFTYFLNKVLIQAIGRICRTNMKSSTIHILADAEIQKHLANFHLPEDVILVREYEKLVSSVTKSFGQSDSLIEKQNLAALQSDRSMANINRHLKTSWSPEKIELWQSLRNYVLRFPVATNANIFEKKWDHFYVELPEPAYSYRYSERHDYRDVEIYFSENHGDRVVSEHAARLPELMEIKLLHDLFVESGWATSFSKSTKMLTPPAFNNIYKGVLGEVVGKFILEHFLCTKLLDLDVDEYEKFDFKTSKGIYIDFKFWHDQFAVEADPQLENIRSKMQKTNAVKVFIINILGSNQSNFKPVISSDKKIIEVPYLCKNGSIDDGMIAFLTKEFIV